MRTFHLPSLAFVAFLLCTATSVSAAPLRDREVRIHHERFAKLDASEQAHVLAIKDRLEALMTMDRSALDPVERMALRSEWKGLKSEMKEMNRDGTVIYLSSAGIIIIILLLILLL